MPAKKKSKRAGSIIFRIVLIVIAGLTVGFAVFSWNASGLVGNQLPMPFGFGVSVVMSSSMEPVLHVNDLVFVKEADTYQKDDIIVFQDGGMLVIHRIIEIGEDTVTTQGDANNAADEPISPDVIKGKLLFKIPFIGAIFKFIKTVPGTLLILAVAVFFLYRSRAKERASDNKELDDIVREIHRLREQQAASDDAASASESEPSSEKKGSHLRD